MKRDLKIAENMFRKAIKEEDLQLVSKSINPVVRVYKYTPFHTKLIIATTESNCNRNLRRPQTPTIITFGKTKYFVALE